MHFRTHVSDERMAWCKEQYPNADEYSCGMVEHDMHIGRFLKALDELGIADNTIVIYSTDNGAETFTWPDGGITPFHGEKGTTWEGGFRVPLVVRWPGVIKPGTVYNDIISQEDWMPTLLAAAGEPNIVEKLKNGYEANGKTFKVHPDGYNFLPYFKGEVEEGPREEIFYFSQGGDLNAIRVDDWKIHFATINGNIATGVRSVAGWPLLINLRRDPYERGMVTSNTYNDWFLDRPYLLLPAGDYAARFLSTFKDYPPRQKPGSFNLERVMEAVTSSQGTGK